MLPVFFPTDFREILGCQISWKSFHWSVELFHADGQKDMKKVIVAFRIFRTRLKIIFPEVKKNKKHRFYWHKIEVYMNISILQLYKGFFLVIAII